MHVNRLVPGVIEESFQVLALEADGRRVDERVEVNQPPRVEEQRVVEDELHIVPHVVDEGEDCDVSLLHAQR